MQNSNIALKIFTLTSFYRLNFEVQKKLSLGNCEKSLKSNIWNYDYQTRLTAWIKNKCYFKRIFDHPSIK